MSLQDNGAKVYDRPEEADKPQAFKSPMVMVGVAIIFIIAAIFIYTRFLSPARSSDVPVERTTLVPSVQWDWATVGNPHSPLRFS